MSLLKILTGSPLTAGFGPRQQYVQMTAAEVEGTGGGEGVGVLCAALGGRLQAGRAVRTAVPSTRQYLCSLSDANK